MGILNFLNILIFDGAWRPTKLTIENVRSYVKIATKICGTCFMTLGNSHDPIMSVQLVIAYSINVDVLLLTKFYGLNHTPYF